MPSGGSTPLDDEQFRYVKAMYEESVKHGMQYEWLQWFVGGLYIDKKTPEVAAADAATEWDF